MVTLIYQRPTLKDKGHTKVFLNGVYLGYLIQETSSARTQGENWHTCLLTGHSAFSNRKKAITFLKQIPTCSV